MRQKVYKRTIYFLSFIAICLAVIILSSFAFVSVTSEKATFSMGTNENGGIERIEVYKEQILIVYDCDVHKWRKARFRSEYGSINLSDVKLIFGKFPDCNYVPSVKPSDVLPDDVWKKRIIFLDFCV